MREALSETKERTLSCSTRKVAREAPPTPCEVLPFWAALRGLRTSSLSARSAGLSGRAELSWGVGVAMVRDTGTGLLQQRCLLRKPSFDVFQCFQDISSPNSRSIWRFWIVFQLAIQKAQSYPSSRYRVTKVSSFFTRRSSVVALQPSHSSEPH